MIKFDLSFVNLKHTLILKKIHGKEDEFSTTLVIEIADKNTIDAIELNFEKDKM